MSALQDIQRLQWACFVPQIFPSLGCSCEIATAILIPQRWCVVFSNFATLKATLYKGRCAFDGEAAAFVNTFYCARQLRSFFLKNSHPGRRMAHFGNHCINRCISTASPKPVPQTQQLCWIFPYLIPEHVLRATQDSGCPFTWPW